MSDEVLVKVDNVSKKFCRDLKKSLWYGLQDVGTELIGKKYDHELRPDEFWSLKDISFEIKRGECLGLIGRNGAGKSTLLRVLNGLIKPDRGSVTLKGKVAGLIALGAGFNPILTGRENIYINGSMLGYTKKQIDEKFDEIVTFSEIEEFIDTPVQNYSSGMNVRLGFSAAVFLTEPDVLLLDEVLAVGDIGFVIKCFNKIRELMEDTAVILVTHSMQYLSLFCNSLLMLKNGEMLFQTDNMAQGIDQYLSVFPVESNMSGTDQARISHVILYSSQNSASENEELQITSSDILHIKFELEIDSAIDEAEIMLVVKSQTMNPIIACPLFNKNQNSFKSGKYFVDINIGSLNVIPGKYSFVIAVTDKLSQKSLYRLQGVGVFRMVGDKVYYASTIKPVTYQCQTIKEL